MKELIPKRHMEALRILVELLPEKEINWAIMGSTNLVLQGIDLEYGTDDIDILTDKDGAFAIEKILKKFMTKAVGFREVEKFKAYHGTFRINNIHIDVVGDMINKIPNGDTWKENLTKETKTIVFYDALRIPVVSLDREHHAYTKRGRIEKAKMIKERMAKES
ncbi:MAG: hypothetical protein KAT43_03800 [Nanoarchaeota archaeon]|nr:hypothetical protein [Nanoarchaeota archaeon]